MSDMYDPRVLAFFLASVPILIASWRSLMNPRCHGFYRFFALEGTLALVVLNFHLWTSNPNATLQLISSLFLYSSIIIGLGGLWLMKTASVVQPRESAPENFAFENTTSLISHGIFRLIRHPMYSSLLLLAWGAFTKDIGVVGSFLVLATTAAVILTARVEERENLEYFGGSYREYMNRTKLFIPFVY